MIIETISVTQRKNLGNYEHIEISSTAKLEEGESPNVAILALKSYVANALESKEPELPVAEAKEKVAEVPPEIPSEAVVEEPKKPKASRKAKEKVTEEKTIPYDRTVDSHRQFLSSYLTQNHPEWKNKEGIKEFSASLIGKPFLNKEGNIIDSFKKEISDFFA